MTVASAARAGPSDASRATWMVAATALAALTAVAGVAGWEWLRSGERESVCFALATLLALLSILPWVVGHLRRRFDMLEPAVVLGLIVLLAYVLPGFGILAGADVAWQRAGWRARLPTLTLLAPALALAVAGLGSFLGSYYATGAVLRRPPSLPGPSADPRRLRRWTVVFAVGAVVSLTVFVVLVGGPVELLSRLNDRVRLFAGLNYLLAPVTALISLALVHFCRDLAERGAVRWRVWAGVGAAFGVNLLQGSKTSVLGTAFAFLAAHHYFRRRVSTLAAVSAAVVGIVAAMAYDLFFREYLVIRAVVSLDLSLNPLEVVRLGWAAFSSNAFVQLPVLMLMLDGMPDVLPFQLGRPYIALLLMPIPRALFPSKPPVGTEIFSSAFFPDLLVDGTSMPTSMLGEFYFNFGPAGVLVGCAVAGVIARRMYARAEHARPSTWDVAVYGAFVATLFPWVRGDTFGPTIFFLTVVGPVLLLRRLSTPRPAP